MGESGSLAGGDDPGGRGARGDPGEALQQRGPAALGGLACVIPNALFALQLSVAARTPGGTTIHGLFVGEFVKVAVTVLLLVAVAKFYRDLHWLAFIIGCIATLKSYFLMFFFGRRLA